MKDGKHLTPAEAWADFWENVAKNMKPRPNELNVANRTAKGMVSIDGKVIALGRGRIKTLLDKYAPGQYELHTFFVKVVNHPSALIPDTNPPAGQKGDGPTGAL